MTSPSVTGLRVLVVEDEMMIAFHIEDCLTALGHEVLGPVSHVDEALRLVAAETFDVALLDINLAGEQSYPVAAKLKARNIPFVFLSGYGAWGLSREWAGSSILEKPFSPEGLIGQIETAMKTATR